MRPSSVCSPVCVRTAVARPASTVVPYQYTTIVWAVLFGYLLRLGVIFLAVILVKDAGWVSLPALGFTIIITHLGLLFWELRHVSATLAYPGLKPTSVSRASESGIESN